VIYSVCKAGLFLTLESEAELTSVKMPEAPSSMKTAKLVMSQPPVSEGSVHAIVIEFVLVDTLVGAIALLGF
jgi:hypothetical protein